MFKYFMVFCVLAVTQASWAQPLLDQRVPTKLETATFGLG